MKKVFFIFLVSVGLVFGASKSGDIERLSSLFSTLTDERIGPEDKKDIILFYNAFIDPLESDAKISKKINNFFASYGDVMSDFMFYGMEIEFFEKIQKILSSHPAIVPSLKQKAVSAIYETIGNITEKLQKKSIAFAGSAPKETRKTFDFIISSIDRVVNENQEYFYAQYSDDVQSLDRQEILGLLMLYFMRDKMEESKAIEVEIVNRGLIEKQMNRVLEYENIQADVMLKSHYTSFIDCFKDYLRKYTILSEIE